MTDYLRVDLLVDGVMCGPDMVLFASEMDLYPCADFDDALKDEVTRRWLRGYGILPPRSPLSNSSRRPRLR